MVKNRNLNIVMESRDHFKNGTKSKSQMIRGNRMHRLFLFLAVFGICIASAFAQDVITLKNAEEIQAIVQEIGEVEIKYKKFENPNGPNYILKKSEIFTIKYENGSRDVFVNEVSDRDVFVDVAESEETDHEPVIRQSELYNDNSSTNVSFILKKNDKIAVRIYGLRLAQRNMRKALEKKLQELGFCCIYGNIKDENITSMDIVVHPDGASSFRFRIFDKSLKEGEVFAASYRWSTMFTVGKIADNFIKDITPFIEK